MCGSPSLVSLFVVGLLAASSWYTFNVLFYGSLSEGQTITEVLMVASSTQTLQRLSIFSQWPVYLPANATPPPTTTTIIPVDGCGDGYGCQGPNSVPDVRCPSTRACNVLGKQPVCLLEGQCLDLCFVGQFSQDSDCNMTDGETHGILNHCYYSAPIDSHYRMSLLNTSYLNFEFFSGSDSFCLSPLSMFALAVESCTPFSVPTTSTTVGYLTMLLAECSDFCNDDGFGCHLTSDGYTEYSFCHTSQDCYANGGSVSCSQFPSRGSCILGSSCGDGYGCQGTVPDVACPLTRQCLYDGGEPVCDFVPVPSPPIPVPTPTPVVPTTTTVPCQPNCVFGFLPGSNCTEDPFATFPFCCGTCYNGFLLSPTLFSFRMDCLTMITTFYEDANCASTGSTQQWAYGCNFNTIYFGADILIGECPTISTLPTTVDCDNCLTLTTLNNNDTCADIINTTSFCCGQCVPSSKNRWQVKQCGTQYSFTYDNPDCIGIIYNIINIPYSNCIGGNPGDVGYITSRCIVPPPSPIPNTCSCTAYSYSGTTLCDNSPNFVTAVGTDVCNLLPSVTTGEISLQGTCTSWTVYYGSLCSGISFAGANNSCINDGVNSWKVVCLPPAPLPPPPPPSVVPPPFLDCRQRQCAINFKRNFICTTSYWNSLYVGQCGICLEGAPVIGSYITWSYKMSCSTGQVSAYLSLDCSGPATPIANPAPCNQQWTVTYVNAPAVHSALNVYSRDTDCSNERDYQYRNLVVGPCQYAYRFIVDRATIWKSISRNANGDYYMWAGDNCQGSFIHKVHVGVCDPIIPLIQAWGFKTQTTGLLEGSQRQTQQTLHDVSSRQKRRQTSVGSCLDNACLPYEGGYIPDVSNSRVQQCMDNGGTPVCELLSQNATFKCSSLCSNYIVYRDKDDCVNATTKNIIYSQPTTLSSCTQDLSGRYVKYMLITGPTYSNRALQITYTDSTCTVKANEVVVNFANNPSRTCSSLPSTFQTVAISIAECSVIKFVDHCVPTLIGSNYFSLPAIDDLEVVSCRSSGSVPYCPYNVDGTPSDYQCNEWCKLDTIWLGTRDTVSCVGGGLLQPLANGDPVGYTKMGDCSPSLGFYVSPQGAFNSMIRIIPFYSLQIISGTQKILVESYSDVSCLNFASRAILDQDYCSSNTYRQTLGSCSVMDYQWNGVDGYGCHLRHVNNIYRPISYECSLLDVDGCSCGTSCNASIFSCACEANPNCAFVCGLTSGGSCNPSCVEKPSSPAQETQKYYLPNELSPSTISCMQAGRSPHCTYRGDTGWVGACDDMCYWQDSFNCLGGQCPYGAMFPLVDSRGLLQKAGQCFSWDSELNSDFVQPYGPARSMRGTYFGDQIALRFYEDDGCEFALPLSSYPVPISYRAFQCFSNNANCFAQLSSGDATVLKLATCEEACNPDGYGCGFQNSGSYSSFGLPQLSCPSSQECLAGCPTAGTELVNCFSEFAVPGFNLAGACPCQLIPQQENIAVNRQYNETYHKTRSFFGDIFKQVTYYNLSHSDVKYEPLVVDSNTTTTLDFILNIGKHGMQYIDRRMVGNPSGLNGCSLGIGLVFDKGQNPTIQIVEGQPLIVPLKYVIFAQVYEFTVNTPDFATLIPFNYDSQNDPEWIPLQMNQGERILLLATLQCGSNIQSVTVEYDGTFNWMYNFQ